MAILFFSPADNADQWRQSLSRLLPELDFRVWPGEIGDPADIEYAVVWNPEPGSLKALPNLKGVFCLGAGIDFILAHADLPAGVPIVRLVDRGLTQGMCEYVVHWVLHFHRGFQRLGDFQRRRHWAWEELDYPEARHRRVGILGLGELGRDAAAKLVGLDFAVAGWSRRPKEVSGVESFHGEDGLVPFLQRTEIVVCLLPLTPATEGIMDARLFAALPEGAFVLNPGRGGHVVDAELIAALDSGHLAGAVLDVFRTEPLPADDPLWGHPKVIVTPHVASLTMHDSASAEVAANIRRMINGEDLPTLVDPRQGY